MLTPQTYRTAKICLLGDAQVGKTTIATCSGVSHRSAEQTRAMGVSIHSHEYHNYKNGNVHKTKLLIWEVNCEVSRRDSWLIYLRGATSTIIACDLSTPATCRSVPRYIKAVRSIAPNSSIYIVINKIDLTPAARLIPSRMIPVWRSGKVAATCAIRNEGVEPIFADILSRLTMPLGS